MNINSLLTLGFSIYSLITLLLFWWVSRLQKKINTYSEATIYLSNLFIGLARMDSIGAQALREKANEKTLNYGYAKELFKEVK